DGSDDRDFGAGAQDRGVHRPDAALRDRGTGADRADRPGPRHQGQGGCPVSAPSETRSSAAKLRPDLAGILQKLRPGQRIRITQTVRVGLRSWPATVEGTFRGTNYLATGLSTDRVPEDDIVVPTVHFTKDNQELSSVTLDENSKIEILP